MFVLNMSFRLANAVGENRVLLVGFDITTRYRSGISIWRRPFHYLVSAFIMWTYPRVIEQKYPSDILWLPWPGSRRSEALSSPLVTGKAVAA
ncbi:hypothetical protein MYCTH_2311268 [Thermothelomyces thermophilus ATCC 42464]|uniref:Uncharacterized protein n=1 Tax=Thermothelomyces thermophilus (strain ATCC 42464 / BCRC 31852 / DSM 1799) TaxID=573729 RepID=G2QNP6_THET4|nr:uncharacterized protein MYCTH_2311268 [Thermothelomyces thermophilus ATCC 42464]AEO61270.1 hypothetical protein MYCTH_2311268 [Thermothelomyces thermophilus ATCC 42464]